MCKGGEVYGMWKEFTEQAREISLRSRRDRDEKFFWNSSGLKNYLNYVNKANTKQSPGMIFDEKNV